MLYKVQVRTSQGSVLDLPFEEVVGGLFVEDIEGLDPVKATFASSDFAGQDGEQYQSSWLERRNITMKLAIEPDPAVESVEDVRLRVYNYLMPKSFVTLRCFKESGLTVDISALVETCETPLFVQEPRVDASLICFDPDFIRITTDELVGNTVEPSEPPTSRYLLAYPGTATAGIVFQISPLRDVTEFTIYHTTPAGAVRSMEFSGIPLLTGDVVTISTIPGSKGATLLRTGVESSALRAIPPQADWFELTSGNNYFRVEADGDPVPYTITWANRYGGL